MRSRLLLASLFLATLGQLGMSCGGSTLAITFPPANEIIQVPTLLVSVRVPAGYSFDPATDVLINGTPVPLAAAGSGAGYAALIGPGDPLLDSNVIVLNATDPSLNPVSVSHGFDYSPPKARAFEITNPADLISGPLAHNRVGDFMLSNDVARFAIQDGPQRDMYSVGQYGGNLIDAELLASPGLDNFLEVATMANVESVFNADDVHVMNDGQNGLAAVIRACGPDDLLDFANPSSFIVEAGFPAPPGIDDRDYYIRGCTEFRLEPGQAFLEVETTVFDETEVPTADIPLVVGDWLNAAGEFEMWAKPFVPQQTTLASYGGLGEPLLGEASLISFFGKGEAAGVDYGYVTVPAPSVVPDVGNGATTMFNTSGVSVILHNFNVVLALLSGVPSFSVPAGGDVSFTRYMSVGDGSGSNAVDMENEVKGLSVGSVEGCVSLSGAPAGGAHVTLATGALGPPSTLRVFSTFVTKPGTCPNFSGTVPVGSYVAAAARDGALYVGGTEIPPFSPVVVTAGATTSNVDFDLAVHGTLQVTVTEGATAAVPARVTVVGYDPSPEPEIAGPSFPGFGGSTLGLFKDARDRLPFGIVAFAYTDASGVASLEVEPGEYEVFVSRGTEYSLFQQSVTIAGGATTAVAAPIERVIDTTGFISSDFHVHGIRSADSGVSDTNRVRGFAGEGIENPVMTDHHVHTDLGPVIASEGMGSFITSTIGEEITTFDYGHFNGYPFTIDPSVPSGGSTDWGKAAPVGCDFPSPLPAQTGETPCPGPAFNATPSEIFNLAVNGPWATDDTTVQINHIDSYYDPLQIDTGVSPIKDGLDGSEPDPGDPLRKRSIFRLDPAGEGVVNLFHPFPALEVWNGMNRAHQSEFLDQRIGIWMNHLNKGFITTAISDTDTHTFTNLRTAGARTWTASSTDSPAAIDPGEVARSVDEGRAVGGQGIYVQTRLLAQDGSDAVADLTNGVGASTLVASANGQVDLEIKIQAPLWAQFDTVEVYRNSVTSLAPGESYLYTATPDDVLVEGDCDPATLDGADGGDFDISLMPGVTGGQRQQVTLTLPYSLLEDTWFVVVVKGTDGVCEPMFPVYASDLSKASNPKPVDGTPDPLVDGNLGQSGVMALGVTNALFADVNGGGFDPPDGGGS